VNGPLELQLLADETLPPLLEPDEANAENRRSGLSAPHFGHFTLSLLAPMD